MGDSPTTKTSSSWLMGSSAGVSLLRNRSRPLTQVLLWPRWRGGSVLSVLSASGVRLDLSGRRLPCYPAATQHVAAAFSRVLNTVNGAVEPQCISGLLGICDHCDQFVPNPGASRDKPLGLCPIRLRLRRLIGRVVDRVAQRHQRLGRGSAVSLPHAGGTAYRPGFVCDRLPAW